MSETEITLKSLHEEILRTRDELKRGIQAIDAKIALEVETLRKRVSVLEEENVDLRRSVENLESRGRKNNVVIYGLHLSVQEKLDSELVCQEINKLLELDIIKSDVSDVYRLGRSDRSPIKIEFVSYQVKSKIFRNLQKLRGTKVYFVHDLTIQQRELNNRLRDHLFDLRSRNIQNCRIKGDKIYIDGTAYTLAELEQLQEIPSKRRNSAPSTPCIDGKREQVQRNSQEQRTVPQNSELPTKPVQLRNKTISEKGTGGSVDKKQHKPALLGTPDTQTGGSRSVSTKERVKTRSNR